MAQIPVGNFGFATPEVRQSNPVSTRVQDDSAGMVARTLGQAANKFTADISASMAEQAELQARKKKTQAATKVMEYETRLQEVGLDLEKQHAEGTISADALQGAWEQAEKKLREEVDPYAMGLDQETADAMRVEIDSRRVNRLQGFQGQALAATKKEYVSSVKETLATFRAANLGNAVATEAYINGEFGAEIDRAFGADAPAVKREAIEEANRDAITLAITNAGDDTGRLSQVLNQLNSKESQTRLDPDFRMKQVSALTSTINTLNDRAAYKAEVAQNKREREAEAISKRFETHIADGGIATPEMIAELGARTKGTVYEVTASEYASRQDEIQGLLKAPEPAQRAWLADTRARMNEQGSTPEEKKFVDSMEQQINKRATMRKENPLEAGEIELGAKPTVVDWANPDPDAIAERVASRDVVMKAQGKDPGVLKKQEVDAITERLDKASPDQVIAELKGLSDSLGGDRELYNSAMQQINSKSSTYSLAGKWASAGRDKDAITLLEGKKVVDDKQIALPSMDKFSKSVMNTYGSTLRNNPAVAKAAVENAYAVYASLAAKDGIASNEVNDGIKQEAFKIAIGETTSLRLGGDKLIVPYGKKPVEHKDAVLRGYAAAAAEYGGDIEADDLQFIQRPGGKYQVFDGREPKLDASGRPIMVNPIYE